MALWQIVDTKKGKLKPQWDDGLPHSPGDEEFTTDRVVDYAGAGNFNYMGTPNWEPPVEEPVEEPAGEEGEG